MSFSIGWQPYYYPKKDDIRPITDGIKQYRNFGYKFKMSTIGPRNGYWDVNGGILRWLDKEIVLKKLLVTVHKVCHHFSRHQKHTPSKDPRTAGSMDKIAPILSKFVRVFKFFDGSGPRPKSHFCKSGPTGYGP